MKKEKNYFDPESNNNTHSKLINYSFLEEELKSIQRSIALLRQDIPHIIHDELIRFLNQNRCNI